MLAAALLPVAEALCGAWENWLLFDIQAAFTLGDYSPAIANLPSPVAAKFLLLAATTVIIGEAATRIRRGWALKIAHAYRRARPRQPIQIVERASTITTTIRQQ